MSVKLLIRSRYNNFSNTYKRVSDYILANPEEVLNLTAIEIADRCKTSSASVIRYVKSIGFLGLDDFKIQLAKVSSESGEKDINHIDSIISKDDNIEKLCDKLHMLIDNSNKDLFYQIDKNSLVKSFELIKNAENIYLLGIGASLLPAYDLYHKLKRVNFNSHFFFDTHMVIECFNYITNRDVVIAFSYSGATNEIVYPVEIALSKGANVIAITRNKQSPLSKIASIILSVPDSENLARIGAITSKYSSMMVNDLLYLGVIQKDFEKIEKDFINTNMLTRKIKLKGE